MESEGTLSRRLYNEVGDLLGERLRFDSGMKEEKYVTEGFELVNPECYGYIVPFPSKELIKAIIFNPGNPEMVELGNFLAEKFPHELGLLKR